MIFLHFPGFLGRTLSQAGAASSGGEKTKSQQPVKMNWGQNNDSHRTLLGSHRLMYLHLARANNAF